MTKLTLMKLSVLSTFFALALMAMTGCKQETTTIPASSPTAPAPAASPTPTPAATTAKPAALQSTNEVAVIKTSAGEMVAELWPDVAPKTVENFKKLARQGFYDGTASHRLIAGFMIQMGDPLTKDPNARDRWGSGGPGYTIPAEFNPRKHERGVLSMARGMDPNSAGSQFFICFSAKPDLDGQYTTFGRLVKGEEVLGKLESTPCGPGNDGDRSAPIERVAIESIRIVPGNTVQ